MKSFSAIFDLPTCPTRLSNRTGFFCPTDKGQKLLHCPRTKGREKPGQDFDLLPWDRPGQDFDSMSRPGPGRRTKRKRRFLLLPLSWDKGTRGQGFCLSQDKWTTGRGRPGTVLSHWKNNLLDPLCTLKLDIIYGCSLLFHYNIYFQGCQQDWKSRGWEEMCEWGGEGYAPTAPKFCHLWLYYVFLKHTIY